MTERHLSGAPFPAPPPFWKFFTAENLDRLKGVDDVDANGEHGGGLPNELQFLRPPTPPVDIYSIFGEEQTLSAVLPPLGDLQLFPSTSPSGAPIDHTFYLTKITKSLLLNILEFTTRMSADPMEALPKLEDIKILFINAHHLINMYRPHQARETLIMMMENQLQEGKREIERSCSIKEKAEEKLREIERCVSHDSRKDVLNERMAEAKNGREVDGSQMWQMIHKLEDELPT